MPVEPERIRTLNAKPRRDPADYVLYWSQMNRRVRSNHALAHAVQIANDRHLPLLVYERLTARGEHASDRLFTFILEAVPATAKGLREIGAGYFFHLSRPPEDPNSVLSRLTARAHCVVTDDYPVFLAASNNAILSETVNVECLAVDAGCIVPMSVHEKRAWGAYTIRPKIRRELPKYLRLIEVAHVGNRWSDRLLPAGLHDLRTTVKRPDIPALVASLPINHSIGVSHTFTGGPASARKHLDRFLETRLARYAAESNQPSRRATSDLSPFLHFGQISALEVALRVREYAEEHGLIADDFLEELIVRRELAFNFARFTPNLKSLDALPDWCRKTIEKHAGDPRPHLYAPEQLEAAETADPLWNATQKELLLRGKIHGYYRMYWGKKIIEWTPTCALALKIMIRLHDIYALDGRDPNTYTNILWCFGLHDRPWAERPIFGQLRYMSYEGMRRKTDVAAYIEEIETLERTGKDPYRV